MFPGRCSEDNDRLLQRNRTGQRERNNRENQDLVALQQGNHHFQKENVSFILAFYLFIFSFIFYASITYNVKINNKEHSELA